MKGYEVKSIRNGRANLRGAYVVVLNGALYVKGMHIAVLPSVANKTLVFPERERKLFLHKKTVIYLSAKIKEAGFSVIPMELYFVGSLIKIKVSLAKGRKAYQKKQVLKERTLDKEAKIAMNRYV